jgi:hypothetical protein
VLFLVHRFCHPDEGGARFLRNVGFTRATRRNNPEDTILHVLILLFGRALAQDIRRWIRNTAHARSESGRLGFMVFKVALEPTFQMHFVSPANSLSINYYTS